MTDLAATAHGSSAPEEYVLTLSCPDRPGIVRAVSDLLYQAGCDITESHQFGDRETGRFYLRVAVNTSTTTPSQEALVARLDELARPFKMEYEFHDSQTRTRIVLMVSTYDHCAYDLLYRVRTGQLVGDIVAVVSNHPDLQPLAEWHSVPFHHIPVTAGTKPQAEEKLRKLLVDYDTDLVVLARYMQILSADLCEHLAGRAINIHHSFLPSFKGASPYRQAHERGVKLIGATAHYVTSDLDEGPIIEQGVARVDHQASTADLMLLGQDMERQVLARAVQWHTEHRIHRHGNRTIVFT